MPDMGNEKITGIDHYFVGLGNGKSGMNRNIEWIKAFVKAVRIDRIQAGMIGLDMDEADMRINGFGFGERAQGEAVECAVAADEELGDAVFGDAALDGREKDRIQVGGGVGVAEEEAGFLRHRDHLND